MKKWYYTSAKTSLVGRMVCSCCSKPITTGMFRYRDAGETYITQHRKCTPNDKNWGRLDNERNQLIEYNIQRKLAYDDFVAKWGVPDDLIGE